MKISSLFLLSVAGIILAGCSTLSHAPSALGQITIERVDSPVVIVEKAWLERNDSPLVIKGSVIKRRSTDLTTETHLDVTCYDGSGVVLRSTVERFEPRQIPGHQPSQIPARRHKTPFASYSVALNPVPLGTVRIQVRAHEGDHPSAP